MNDYFGILDDDGELQIAQDFLEDGNRALFIAGQILMATTPEQAIDILGDLIDHADHMIELLS